MHSIGMSLLSLLLMCGLSVCYEIRLEDSDDKLRQCEIRVIDKLFGSEELVYFIFSGNDYEMLPFDIANPKVIINVNDTNTKIHIPSHYSTIYKNFIQMPEEFRLCKPKQEVISTEYARNFIFQINHFVTLSWVMDYLTNSAIWNNNESPRGTFLIITTYPVERFFPILWKLYIRKVVILEKNRHNIIKLYTANAHEQGNECGKMAKIYSNSSCEDPDLNIAFQDTLKNYGGCPVASTSNRTGGLQYLKDIQLANFTFNTLHRYCNAIVSYVDVTSNTTHFIEWSCGDISDQGCPLTNAYYISNWVFVVPIPEQIGGIEVFIFIFKKELWTLLLVSFFFTVAIWLLIVQTSENSNNSFLANTSLTFFTVFSVTVWGNISKSPKRLALRCLFLSYVIYSMHIQTAYISMLIRVLTIPQFRRGITTLQGFAESDLSLCISEYDWSAFYSEEIPEYEIYSNIQKKKRIAIDNPPMFEYDNCSTVEQENDILIWQDRKNHTLANKLINGNSIMTPLHHYFFVNQGSYLLDTLNYIMITSRESGIFTKIEKDVDDYFHKKHTQRTIVSKPTVLGMGHLFGVFVIWGFCMLISIIVFLLELAINKWSRAT